GFRRYLSSAPHALKFGAWCLEFLWSLKFGVWSFVPCSAVVIASWNFSVCADTILASKHDLSSTGPGTIKATAESDVCGFCHTPHRGTGETPLWNHAASTATYT